MNQSKLKLIIQVADTKARENVSERVTIVFGFTSDWMQKRREFFKPIVVRS